MKTPLKRFISYFMFSVILISMPLSLTGCTADNSMVTAAFANSPIVKELARIYQEQEESLLELYRLGVLSYAQYSALSNALKADEASSVGILGAGMTINVTEDESGNSTTEITGAKHPYVQRIAKAMSYMAGYPSNCSSFKFSDTNPIHGTHTTSHSKNNYRDCIISNYGATYFPAYGGYCTRCLIKSTDYWGDFGGSGSDSLARGGEGNTAYCYSSTTKSVSDTDRLKFWDDGTALDPIVTAFNRLANINVYALDPAIANNSELDLSAISNALSTAVTAGAGSQAVIDLKNTWFKTTVKLNYNPGWEPITRSDIYKPVSLKVTDNGRHIVTIEIDILDISIILDQLGTVLDNNFSDGILIGNELFITKYDVAAFHGFREVGAAGSKEYAPIYTYQTEGTTPARWDFTGVKSSEGLYLEGTSPTSGVTSLDRTVNYTTATGGTSKKVEELIIDFDAGRIYRKGAMPGEGNDFMSLGSSNLLSSVIVADTTFKRIAGTPYISPSYNTNASVSLSQTTFTAGVSYQQPLFILVDYLELVYSPGVIADEPLVAYGRKVRLDDKVVGGTAIKTTDKIAYIVDSGSVPSLWNSRSYQSLTIKDFIDIDGIWKTDGTIKSTQEYSNPTNPDVLKHTAAVHVTDSNTAGTYMAGDPTAERGDRLPQIAAGKGIECVVRFGSNLLDKADNKSADPQTSQTPLYGIALYGGLYDRGLFSNWINASGNAGLESWASIATKLGYPNYNISGAVLTENLRGNYAFELNQDGLLSLDLDTVIEISKQNVEDRRGYGVMILRTVLLVLGFVLVAYVSVLLAAWALDVNLDLGLNILQKVSFGHFVAVRSTDEMPEPDLESKTSYVDFRGIIIRSIAFAVVGVLLITIDPVGLIIKVLNGLNFLLNEISKLIFGTKLI